MTEEIRSKNEPPAAGAEGPQFDPEDYLLNHATDLMSGFSKTQSFIRQLEQWAIDQDLSDEVLEAMTTVSKSGADFFHCLGGLAGQLSWRARE